ncbi:hypothetical protein H9L19_04170 [Weissella diestrammenae]|uniref:Uncharacterized protein n=1 Tax=Weissella diestrammenae TaxID=1162633 RepID=A0A7G9T3G5_9LACO|nr:hypothetical protein [Weissella diestrammenae]MCM0582098.1 hypothetical protein [Weissella diestrammenae]QNN74640.1 hypothetical protein H9L19_04170 [Weissella diestrammenae]
MVKQGSFAQSSSIKQQKNFRRRQPAKQMNQIDDQQLHDFLLVRYHLTQKHQQAPIVQETMSRFLEMLINEGDNENHWQLQSLVTSLLQRIGNQVPWQFYYILASEWTKFTHFLVKELPSVPLARRKTIDTLSTDQFQMILKQHLAINWFMGQYAQQPERLGQVTRAQIDALEQGMSTPVNQIDWQRVQSLYSTVPLIEPQNGEDVAGLKWWQTLRQIKV